MRWFTLIFAVSLSLTAASQNTVNVDQQSVPLSNRVFYTTGGHPVSSAKYVSLTSGSPYFSDNWMSGTILTKDSAVYSRLTLKVDMLDHTVIYLNEDNQEMVSVAPIIELSLRDTLNENGKTYLFISAASIPGASGKGWYQLVSKGKLTLYKQYQKNLLESKAYMSSITEQSIRTEERYYVSYEGKFVRVKKLKDINEVVANPAFDSILAANKYSDKKETDWIDAVERFNARQQQP